MLEVPNSIRKTRSFTPVLTRDPKIRKDLSKQATVVKLQPTVKTAGETTFSSTRLPIKAVTVNPDKLVKSSSNYNPKLVKTIKSGTVRNPTVKNNGATDPVKTIKNPIRTTTCVKCTKSLLLIRK